VFIFLFFYVGFSIGFSPTNIFSLQLSVPWMFPGCTRVLMIPAKPGSRYSSIITRPLLPRHRCNIGRTVCVYRLRYREKREGERCELYMREKCAISPASSSWCQHFIYMQQTCCKYECRNRVHRIRYTEKREGKRLEIYTRELRALCPSGGATYGQLGPIYAT
jgi:hypothetical protein